MRANIKIRLRVKLTLAFMLVTMALFLTISFVANYILKSQFEEYVTNQQELKNTTLVTQLSQRYKEWGNSFDILGMENLGVDALGQGLMIRVHSEQEGVIWDAHVHNSGMCASILETMAASMQNTSIGNHGGYTEKTYPLKVGTTTIGTVDVGYYGPYFLTENDIRFLDTLNRLLFWSAILATLFSFFVGVILAKRITRPLDQIITSASRLAEGNYDATINENSTTYELQTLAVTINTLANNLSKQELLRKRLTADIAHELRTPLATLQSHLEAMIDGIWEADTVRLSSCHEEIIYLTKMVGSLENLAKYDMENIVLDIVPVDVIGLINRLILGYEPLLKQKNLTLTTDLKPIELKADYDKLNQILVNLISNAVKYTHEGGHITLATYQTETESILLVSDTGIGISSNDLPFVFERFFRADTSRNRQTGGVGIGLSITKALVTAHNGTIDITSELNKGTTVSLRFKR